MATALVRALATVSRHYSDNSQRLFAAMRNYVLAGAFAAIRRHIWPRRCRQHAGIPRPCRALPVIAHISLPGVRHR